MYLRLRKWWKTCTLVTSRSGCEPCSRHVEAVWPKASSPIALPTLCIKDGTNGEWIGGDRNGSRKTSQELLSQGGPGEIRCMQTPSGRVGVRTPHGLLAGGKLPKCYLWWPNISQLGHFINSHKTFEFTTTFSNFSFEQFLICLYLLSEMCEVYAGIRQFEIKVKPTCHRCSSTIICNNSLSPTGSLNLDGDRFQTSLYNSLVASGFWESQGAESLASEVINSVIIRVKLQLSTFLKQWEVLPTWTFWSLYG